MNTSTGKTTFSRKRQQKNPILLLRDALFSPIEFFRSIPGRHENEDKQWVWAGVLILALIGLNAVRASLDGIDAPISDQVVRALEAASPLLLIWFGQSIALGAVALLRGKLPQLALNAQVVVWAAAPYAVMALVQILYVAAGGSLAEPYLNGLLARADASPFMQALLGTIASGLTVFTFWNGLLLWVGARQSLQATRAGAAAVLAVWLLMALLVPTLLIVLLGG